MNVIVRVVYGENRNDGLPESAEVEWTDAVDQPDAAHIYAVLGLLTEAGRRRTMAEMANGPKSPGERIAEAMGRSAAVQYSA